MNSTNDGKADASPNFNDIPSIADQFVLFCYICFATAEATVQVGEQPLPFPAEIDLLTATIQELQNHLTSGLITSQQLILEYLVRYSSSLICLQSYR
jgi:hypothetical protein